MVYNSLKNDPSLNKHLIKCYFFDDESKTILLEYCKDYENLFDYHLRINSFASSVSKQIGTFLGHLHSNHNRFKLKDVKLYKSPPWISKLGIIDINHMKTISKGNYKLLQIINQHTEFQELFDYFNSTWEFECLINGDLRWKNILVPKKTKAKQIKVIDWELSLIGDPCWDIGTFLSEYLSFCVLFSSVNNNNKVDDSFFQKMLIQNSHPVFQEFWKAYCRSTGEFKDI